MKRTRSIVPLLGALLAALGLVMAGLVATPATAGAQSSEYQRGPNPADDTLLDDGPFSTSRAEISGGFLGGFNNATVCYPDDTSEGTFGGLVVMPGFLASKAQMMWSCDTIASHGFVVAVAATNSGLDFPGARADQSQAIIQYLSGNSAPNAVQQRLDTSRWAAAGWSMGGGGALDVGNRNNPAVEAVVAWQPWNIASYGGMTVPSMIIGASNDLVASTGAHAEPFYNSILFAEKYYVELAGQGHFVGSSDNTIQSAATIGWLKRWVDNDTRYDRFFCPEPSNAGIAEIRSSCPLQGD